MNVQTTLFWLTGVVFFVVQLGVLLVLMRQGRGADAEQAANGRLEVVWTLVPASLIAALALMLGGLTQRSWTRPEDSAAPRPGVTLRWAGSASDPVPESRR